MAESSVTSGGGVGTASLLGVLFIGLKLAHMIDWPWLWVLAPFWLGLAVVLAVLACCGIVLLVSALFGQKSRR